MRITDVETYHCHDGTRNSVFLRVLTDEGITGSGQPYTVGPDEAILAAVESSKRWFIGQDPARIEWLLRRAKNTMRFPLGPIEWSFLSGIDHALWDIAGKAAGVPVYRLLGGPTRDRVRVYRQLGGETPEALAAQATKLLAEGYTAFKASPYPPGWRSMQWLAVVRAAAERLEALRAAVGNGPDVAIDVHSTLREPARARQLVGALTPYRLMFVEEPVRPDYIPSTARLRAEFRVALATGENLYGITQFAELFDRSAVDIVQPDLLCCGGLLETKKIAAMAEANYVTVAPHNPLGLLSTALGVHLAASITNFVIMEYHGDHELPKARFVKDMWKPVNGYFELPTAPGLGMELDLEAIVASPPRHWNRGFPTYADGSPAFI
ncbi:MAG: mandelate racemase/muconate lactonizing enzyme family protein [Gemmatimonadetes bacterium]|nr:mandelate racemase/muconate lactonizing enzyme family protein [Gemmatimonadota bacterium]